MNKQYIGALDQGTTSSRFVLVDKNGSILTQYQREHRQYYPQQGWVEHDPIEIRNNCFAVIRGALREAGIPGSALAALGITNQRETTVAWNPATGEPYGPAIVWQDIRTADICSALRESHGEVITRKTGLPVATYFSGPKIRWMLEHLPGVRAAAKRRELVFGTMDAWMLWWLTGGPSAGVCATDVSNASRTLLMDLYTLRWDERLCELMGVPLCCLPEIRSSSGVLGETKEDGPLGARVPVAGILGDQQAALFGQTCFERGEMKNTYGTGCFLVCNTGCEAVVSENGLVTTLAYRLQDGPAYYALEGSIAIAGSLVQWFRDNLGMIESSKEIEALARSVPDNGGVYFVPAFSGLFAPYWDSEARGVIAGLTHHAGRGHLARAVLEATAFQARDIYQAMRADMEISVPGLRVDGGMVVNDLLMQFQADLLDLPVIRPAVIETTVLGAAFVAGLAVGYWASLEELRSSWREAARFVPAMDPQTRSRHLDSWRSAVERSRGWARAGS